MSSAIRFTHPPGQAFAEKAGLLSGYKTPPGVYDELCSSPGVLRPHWQRFVAALDDLGSKELARRWEQARRIIHEHGVTYNVFGDPRGMDRPWELDALPMLLSSSEWAGLSRALVQRATLLNLLLADVYGPQQLLQSGRLPADLVFPNPGFWRPCHGWQVPEQTYLHLYAAHLARTPSGAWCVLADRTQAPSGAGYAVENRIVISQMLPAVFHDCQVQRLASFFITVRETLHALATHRREQPRIVLLTPGPLSPTYFEDAYLARYLGYTLVEGGDLTVRESHVFLKTLGGLIGVDVILRRMQDDACDPLELSGDSLLGVPGLLQAARSGHVVLANALGSGVLEAPALMAFLPSLCQHLLGEDLQLPSVPTWWCGDHASLAYVLENLDRLVIKPSFHQRSAKPLFGGQLGATERAQWIERIRARPRDFVAQEHLARSSVPVWNGRGLQPGHVALRTFLVAAGGSYEAMPGALSRVSTSAELVGESMLAGQGSKDVWVLSEGPVAPVSLLHPPGEPIALRRSGNDLPSRVADNLYWLGRHVERAEGAARLLRSIVARLTGEAEPFGMAELAVLLRALADQGQTRPEFVLHTAGEAVPQAEHETLAFIFDERRAGGLRATLAAIHRLASVVRDRISLDSWRILNRVEQDFPHVYPLAGMQLGDVHALLNQMVLNLSAFAGLGTESMTRGPGWRFLDMGRRLERALHALALLRSTLNRATADENAVLESLLEIADSSMTYRNRYLTILQLPPVLDLLMTDETNPRSVAYQLVALARHVENLPREQADPLLSAEQRIMTALLAGLRLADIDTLCHVDQEGERKALDRLLARLAGQLRSLSDRITHTYLVHAGPSRQMAEIRPGGAG
ncbi:MAG TPA: circularly permuted type 2 ATP-grasp protein [Pirellulales bacterium]|nr:circularly permuted type 2 ATP-grasp protein [Pirellulales bacterium]